MYFLSQKKRITKPAETLVEVIMAIFILALGSATATSLIITSLQSNSFSRDNLIALNLAVEGIEAVRNIRDTNWLKFSYDRSNCWNMLPQQVAGSDCNDLNNLIDAGDYAVDLNPLGYQWDLTEVIGGTLNLDNGPGSPNNDYLLGFVDVTAANSDGLGTSTDDHDLYISAPYIASTLTALNLPSTGDSRFYRMITIEYSDDPDPQDAEDMRVTCLVQWRSSGVTHSVTLSTSLTNYLQVSTS